MNAALAMPDGGDGPPDPDQSGDEPERRWHVVCRACDGFEELRRTFEAAAADRDEHRRRSSTCYGHIALAEVDA